jgi:excisionase family DNA binding protein
MNEASPWLTTREAAAYLKVKPRTLQMWARIGKIRAYPLSGTHRRLWRFLQGDLDRMLAHSQCAAAGESGCSVEFDINRVP